MQTCKVSYTHLIPTKAGDIRPDVNLPDTAFANAGSLAKALRRAGVLASGGRLASFRHDEKRPGVILCFPKVPGLTTYWHCIRLECIDTRPLIPDFDTMSREALMSFWVKARYMSRYDAECLLGGWRQGSLGTVQTLAGYASNLAIAKRCAAEGDTSGHAIYSHHAALSFGRLPSDIQKLIGNASTRNPPRRAL